MKKEFPVIIGVELAAELVRLVGTLPAERCAKAYIDLIQACQQAAQQAEQAKEQPEQA